MRYGSVKIPGFEAEPIRFTRDYWVARRVLRLIWLVVIALCMAGLIYILVRILQGKVDITFSTDFHRFSFELGGIFTFLAIPISLYGIAQHLENNSKPHLQRYIVRILWMVPIYSVNSWLGLMLGVLCIPEYAIYFDTLRECYEAFTIYSFYCYTVAILEDIKGEPAHQALQGRAAHKHWWPLRWRVAGREVQLVGPWEMGYPFLDRVSFGILNYVVWKPLSTVVTLALETADKYGDGEFDLHKGYVYIFVINNCSQMWALYCLILLYEATADDLASIKPLGKFICVKGVVFFTFWQNSVLSLLGYFGAISSKQDWHCYDNTHYVIGGFQDLLICFEMFWFSIAHAWSFPSREYRNAALPEQSTSMLEHFRSMFDVSDIYEEVTDHISSQSQVIGDEVAGIGRGIKDGVRSVTTSVGLYRNQIKRKGHSADHQGSPLLPTERGPVEAGDPREPPPFVLDDQDADLPSYQDGGAEMEVSRDV